MIDKESEESIQMWRDRTLQVPFVPIIIFIIISQDWAILNTNGRRSVFVTSGKIRAINVFRLMMMMNSIFSEFYQYQNCPIL